MRAKYKTSDLEIDVFLDSTEVPIRFGISLIQGDEIPSDFDMAARAAADKARAAELDDLTDTFSTFLENMETRGFACVRTPVSGATLEIRLDLDTGRTESITTPFEGALPPSDELMARVFHLARESISSALQSDPVKLQQALDDDDIEAFSNGLRSFAIPDEGKREQVLRLSLRVLQGEDWPKQHYLHIASCAASIARHAREYASVRSFVRLALENGSVDELERSLLQLELANSYAAEERFESAIDIYRSLMELKIDIDWENAAWIRHGLGVCLIKTGKATEGLSLLREAGNIRSEEGASGQPWKTLGTAASVVEHLHLREAVALHDEISRGLEPTTAPEEVRLRAYSLLSAARILSTELGNYEQAMKYLSQLNALDPFTTFHEDGDAQASALMLESLCHKTLGDNETAEQLLDRRREFLEARPHLMSAQVEKLLGTEPQETLVGLEKAVQRVSFLKGVQELELSGPVMMVDKVELMIDALDVSKDRDSPALKALLLEFAGVKLLQSGHDGRALSFFLRAVAAHPASIDRRVRLASQLHNMNRLSEAIEVGSSIAEDDPDSHIGFFIAGSAAYRAAEYNVAEHLLKRASALAPEKDDLRKLLEKAQKENTNSILKGVTPPLVIGREPPPTNHPAFIKYLREFSVRGRLNSEAFWQSHKKGKLVQNPENMARALFVQDLMATCRSASIYKETILPGGRIDLIVNILGKEFVVEIKMCGGGYSKSYAEGGFEQLREYLRFRNETRGYLLVFDARAKQESEHSLQDVLELGDGLAAFCTQVDIRGKK
ncbi:MAG: hypothetical protein CL920_24425 [Deltaproteobacteria bacterium]|nr:hypothetical protein [Deltaproteobacteria bacterium]|tara:strand:- start:1876 stop:4227 length:2352 start_codon:yes stop_codon:yes gene_type:complete